MKKQLVSLALFTLALGQSGFAQDAEVVNFDEISITASRKAQKTSKATTNITSVGQAQLKDRRLDNVKEALVGIPGLQAESKNGGYDTRLTIRGAGVKAAYGVREIMVMINGVPVTDPDSFTRLDLIDTELIERVEVVKGPNSTLWGTNATGGVINIITKDGMGKTGGEVKVGGGSFGQKNLHFNYTTPFGESSNIGLGITKREKENAWRRWNNYDATYLSATPNVMLESGAMLKFNIMTSESNLQLPGSLDETMFQTYLETGEAMETSGLWQYSGRYSKNNLISMVYEGTMGGLDFAPRVYYNKWSHHHPVYSRINDADTATYGADLQWGLDHAGGTLLFGLSTRQDTQTTTYYQYGDITTETAGGWSGSYEKITSVNSDAAGSLMEVQNRKTSLNGVFFQETYEGIEGLILEAGVRMDQIKFNIDGQMDSYFSSSTSSYSECPVTATECDSIAVDSGAYAIEKSFSATSPRIGANYQVNQQWNAYGNIAKGMQTPTDGEISENTDLVLVESVNKEVGLRHRGNAVKIDLAYFINDLTNEVIQVLQEDGTTAYANAGKTQKKGFELAANWMATTNFDVGFTYAKNDFKYVEFFETAYVRGQATELDRSGNYMPYTADTTSSITANYKWENGMRASLFGENWGPYYIDHENSETYQGKTWATNAAVGWSNTTWDTSFKVQNLGNKLYSTEVKKSYGNKYYTPAEPQSFFAEVSYKFK